MNKQMKKKTPPMEDSLAPFTDGKEAEPHYTDTIDPELIKPTPKPTPPNAEPSAPGSMKMPDNTTEKSRIWTPCAPTAWTSRSQATWELK